MTDINPMFSKADIQNFSSENEFMNAKVELHKNTIALLKQIIKFRYYDDNKIPRKLSRDEAILGGNLIRLVKLNLSLLKNTCEKKLEICFILNRCIYETQINILYFLRNGEENNFKNYIKHSLITEKEFYKNIQDNIVNRNNEMLPIEKEIKLSIENSFEISEFEIEQLNKSSNWKNLKKRLDKVFKTDNLNEIYNVFYGLSSHSIHGNWQDLIQNHIIQDDDKTFRLKDDWTTPKTNLLEAVILFNLVICKDFANNELELTYKNHIIKTFEKIEEYANLLSQEYDKFREF